MLMLPGQGAQHQRMAAELHGRDPLFTSAIEDLFARLGPGGAALRRDWLADRPAVGIDDASRAQPLLFAVGYALGRSLQGRGVRPVGYLGHSVGELTAAALAGVVDPAGAAAMVAARSAALADAPAGGMLAVGATPEELSTFLDPPDRPDAVVVGAVNAPRQTVLCGPEPRITQVGAALRGAGLAWRRVPALQAYHCPAAAPAAKAFAAGLAGIDLRPPQVRVVSTRTGRTVCQQQALEPDFWAGGLAGPVLFWPALDTLLAEGPLTLVETGPGQGLTVLARRHPAVRCGACTVLPLLPVGSDGAWETWNTALGRIGAD